MKRNLVLLFLFIFSMAWQEKIIAQPFSLDENVKPVELNLIDYKKDDTLRRGRINVTEVTQVKDTLYYFVKGLSMFSPVYFGITAKAESGNIKAYLCKDNWHTINQEGETGANAHWDTKFKTEGDFGIMVVAENKPANYALLVWAGDEAKDVGITSPFKDGVAVDNKTKGGNFFKDNLMYIIIGVLVVVIGFLFFKLKKSKQ